MSRPEDTAVDLSGTARIVNTHLTASLCQEAFAENRADERTRLWNLYLLAQFWVQVALRAPASLTHALEEAFRTGPRLWPEIAGTTQAFFERTKTLSWKFFSGVFHRFAAALAAVASPDFAAEFRELRKHFPEVWIVDGTKLAAVVHRLKLLWDIRSVVLPGCLVAFYDLFRGFPRLLSFDPDAARGESEHARQALAQVPKDTLLVADRLYATAAWFGDLARHGLWGLCRLNRVITIRPEEFLGRLKIAGGFIEEYLANVGLGSTAPIQQLRYIRCQRGKKVFELLTNVLDPVKLPAETALALYRSRWSIERMFYDLKEVLNLNRLYAANPNGVAMQVYAAAIVYVAMRVAQTEVARQVEVKPEAISTAKFYRRVVSACRDMAWYELGYLDACRKNGFTNRTPPLPKGDPRLSAQLHEILRQERKGPRRKRRFCKSRRQWKSFAHVSGGQALMN